ncbi:MAG: winged helix-turn-helix domain-containing protein, partial [Myxococcota bacterium]
TKPFALEELEVRCVALSRRRSLHLERTIELGPLVVDRSRQTVTREGAIIPLRNVGYRIVEYLAENYPRVVTRSELAHHIWKDDLPNSDALRSHIYQLRAVLDKPFARPLVKTVSGAGFVLEVERS